MTNLMLHRGAEPATYMQIRDVPVPVATRTHVPIAHHHVLDMVTRALEAYGHDIIEQNHALTADGARYFGVLSLRSNYGTYTDTLGLRNSHDKTFPIGLAFGSRVFVCDNLAFAADHVVRRKHTLYARRDLPSLVGRIIAPLAQFRQSQEAMFNRYQATLLSPSQADHLILDMLRAGIITTTRVGNVVQQWDQPDFDWGSERTAWRLFNAATYALTGHVVDRPDITNKLHVLMNKACDKIAETLQ